MSELEELRLKVAMFEAGGRVSYGDCSPEVQARLEAMRWRPIDTAPHDGTWLLLYHPDGMMTVGCWVGGEAPDENDPTHWMPLPPPPAWVQS
jgi:hypothetical protein